MIRFDHPWMLWLLLLVPVWVAGMMVMLKLRRRAGEAFVARSLLERVAYSLSFTRLRAKMILWIIAWGLLVVAAADPQVGTKLEEVKKKGIDIMLAVDLSTSMLCEDLSPSRLENAKHEISKFVDGLKGDRVGIVAFAGTAIVHCPLTTDYGAAKLLTKVMNPDLMPEQGTAIADAIDAAKKAFNSPEVKSKVLVIITDGEDHEQAAIDAAKEAAKEGIRIYTIGVGTPSGAPIPMKNGKPTDNGFKRDPSGQVVVTRLNEVLLQQIADAGNGKYLHGTQSGKELDAIWSDISSMEKTEFGKKQFTAFEDRFQYLVLPALLLLLGEFFLSERKGKLWIVRTAPKMMRTRKVKEAQ
ncbi:MAG TPA: VWA domain-containing protein [bacterium]|jgi:Ca-activated chloride channel family protein